MSSRAHDWFRQAERDLGHARRSADIGDHEWACFAAQQAAEKALKALVQHLGGEVRGHSARALVGIVGRRLDSEKRELDRLDHDALEVDRHYIPSRYPNSTPEGAPFEFYGAAQSEGAIAAADRILRFCERNMA
jgi:HEPN domain-containing protein